MIDFLKKQLFTVHQNGKQQVSDVFKYIGPGIIVTVGFIDPGNWAANLAAGASYGYELLWVVTLSTIMLILLQYNVAHLGIVRGQCLSECAYEFLPRYASRFVLSTAGIAAAATALVTALICTVMLITNSYRKLERIIAGFVSLIALAYLVEVNMVNVDWAAAGIGWVDPNIPNTSMLVILSILGAVIMPHNLFLHSEIIQSRQFNTQDPAIMKRQLRYEFLDTLLSMGIGWMINSAMIILAAAVFFAHGIEVTELEQAEELLRPLIGPAAGIIFAIALLFAGFASSATAGMAGASIFAGMFGESYDMKDFHTRLGLALTYIPALLLIVFITDSLQLYMTSSRKVMGEYANRKFTNILLWGIGIIVTIMNIYLLIVG
ncbi:MAG: Nramp family divalent metal transporter [Veillonella sp.]|nr:Nramp family divalent metal transporter [Veillonella sp.]